MVFLNFYQTTWRRIPKTK